MKLVFEGIQDTVQEVLVVLVGLTPKRKKKSNFKVWKFMTTQHRIFTCGSKGGILSNDHCAGSLIAHLFAPWTPKTLDRYPVDAAGIEPSDRGLQDLLRSIDS
jgi:hypothetical protein